MNDLPPLFPDPSADAEELRAALREAADRVAAYLAGLGERPIFPRAPQAPSGDLLPEDGEPLAEVFGGGADWAEENAVHVGHPGYAGHMDSGVAVAGVLADFLASALNQNLLAFELAPGATLLEKRLVRLFADAAGYGPEAGGIGTTGGTTANLTALLLARDAADEDASRFGLSGGRPPCVLASGDAHYSVAKACAVLGIGSERVLRVPVAGAERRMDADALPEAFAEAEARGMRPIALVATAGTTSCGALDPVHACADFCAERGLWLHVDAAHGGALLLHPQERRRLHGIERADSVTLDPHKWLYVPKSAGMLLVRDESRLVTAHYQAPYLDRFSEHGEALPISQGRRALDGSRRFDALKLWMVLRHLGRRGVCGLLDQTMARTRAFHQRLSEHAFFQPLHLPDLNVQAFAPRDPAQYARVAEVHRAVEAQGRFWSSYTVLDGRPCHRIVQLNPSTEERHLEGLLEALEAAHRGRIPRSQSSAGLLHSRTVWPPPNGGGRSV